MAQVGFASYNHPSRTSDPARAVPEGAMVAM